MSHQMSCIHCDGDMVRGPVSITGQYHGRTITVEMPDGYACTKCDFVTIAGKYSAEFGAKCRSQVSVKSTSLG
jgi:hypothetical protein